MQRGKNELPVSKLLKVIVYGHTDIRTYIHTYIRHSNYIPGRFVSGKQSRVILTFAWKKMCNLLCKAHRWLLTSVLHIGYLQGNVDVVTSFRLPSFSLLRSGSSCCVSPSVSSGIFLPRCMECRRSLAMRILSVRPSVCLSVKRVHCDVKLFRTSNTEIIAQCQHYFGFSLPSKLIERKRNKFVNNYNNVSLL